MVELSHVADCSNPRRSGPGWFLDALFPNGKTVNNANARTPGLATVAATLSERTKTIWRHMNGRSVDVQAGLASLVPRSLNRVSEKWESATSSPWFALLCATVSFAVLLLLTGAFAGMALTKQPARTNMTAEPRTEAMTGRAKSQPIERIHDNDLIAVLIELTSRDDVKMEHSAPPAVPLGLSRILLDPRSFATVPLKSWPTNGYLD
jgi:hypothetical protein